MKKNEQTELRILRNLELARNRFHEAKARILHSVGAFTQFAAISTFCLEEYEAARVELLNAEHELTSFRISSR
jgi:hypothetical protein